MKFIVSSTNLLKKIQQLVGVINNTNTLPILNNFLFRINNNELTITASDIETTVTSTIDIESTDVGEIAIPARLLLEAIKTFAEQPLTFTIKENYIIEISSNQGKYALAYEDTNEFPKAVSLDNPSTTTIPGKVLSKAITFTIFASGNDDMRQAMNGVYFNLSDKGLTFVASDGNKLVVYNRSDLFSEMPTDFIMPKKPLQLLKNILADFEESVTIEYSEVNAKFTFGNSELICQLINEKYPNYKAVIPNENPNILIIDRIQFLNSVRRVSLFSDKSTFHMRLKIAGSELNISAEDIDFSNKADERLTCNYQGDDMEIGFNSRYLTEMLTILESKTVLIEMSAHDKAGILRPADDLVKGENITMLVMPVMLKDE